MPFPLSIIPREEFKDNPLLARLLELHDVPDRIYIAGTLPSVVLDEFGRATPRILSVVGSRKHSTYGKIVTEKLASALAGESVVILSGLAFGIDKLSHEAALKNSLTTIAIPGSGLDSRALYPNIHLQLAEDIVNAGGALISEFAPNMQAAQWTFPARNRLVAALSDAILVIEAAEKSGALITARQGLELGRDIGAVPGEITSETSVGTNALIHEGAALVGNDEDLYSLLHLTKTKTDPQHHSFTDDEKTILDILREPMEKDLLLIKSNMKPEHFLTVLSSLEMKGCVQDTFGEVRKVV